MTVKQRLLFQWTSGHSALGDSKIFKDREHVSGLLFDFDIDLLFQRSSWRSRCPPDDSPRCRREAASPEKRENILKREDLRVFLGSESWEYESVWPDSFDGAFSKLVVLGQKFPFNCLNLLDIFRSSFVIWIMPKIIILVRSSTGKRLLALIKSSQNRPVLSRWYECWLKRFPQECLSCNLIGSACYVRMNSWSQRKWPTCQEI